MTIPDEMTITDHCERCGEFLPDCTCDDLDEHCPPPAWQKDEAPE